MKNSWRLTILTDRCWLVHRNVDFINANIHSTSSIVNFARGLGIHEYNYDYNSVIMQINSINIYNINKIVITHNIWVN